MRSFSEFNPAVVFLYFMFVTGPAMFCANPVILVLSLAGAVTFFLVRNGSAHLKSHLGFFLLFVILALINPLISHNGVTVLFVLNNNPVTLEALLYGINSAVMVIAALYWLRSLTQIMTGDRLMYIFGRFSPKLALLISMTLRFVPLFSRQTAKTRNAQKALGLYKDDNIIDTMLGDRRVYSIVITWALENGIITADSMSARGYGTGRRTSFSVFRMGLRDVILLIVTGALFAVCCIAAAQGSLKFGFYPALSRLQTDSTALAGIICYGVLAFLPSVIDMEVNIRWNLLRSRA